MMTACRIFIQARMTSSRLPGKMLAPLAGKPTIAHVVDRLAAADLRNAIVVLTSTEPSDTPLALYVEQALRLPVFRGELENVARRFQAALKTYPADWFIRISGDSPLIDGDLVAFMAAQTGKDCDIVSNVWRRSFPPGQSVECVRASSLLALDTAALTPDEQQHVTPHFYAHADRYRLKRVTCTDPQAANQRMVLDTLDDHANLERMLAAGLNPGYAALARVEA